MQKTVVPTEKARDLLQALQELQKSLDSLSYLCQQGMISDVGTAMYEMTKKKFKLKEEFVLQVHRNKISEVAIKKNGTMTTVYQTRMPDGARPRFISYEGIINHLFDYYTSHGYDPDPDKPPKVEDYSFGAMFEKALEEKIRREKPKQLTIRDYRYTYESYITETFASRDIREISPSECDTFILERLQSIETTEKRLLKFKGLLNLVFNYALDPEHRYIDLNPIRSTNKVFKKYCMHSTRNPEEKAFQPKQLQELKAHLWGRINSQEYDVMGFAILFAASTGVRIGEIPVLKWSDVSDAAIHIHAQQNESYDPESMEVKSSPYVTKEGGKYTYYNPTTKNEKGVSRDGRYFPLTNDVKKILDTLKEMQQRLGIKSEWIFCNKTGRWIKLRGYISALRKVTLGLGFPVTNNHAFRMALNSYVLIPKGIEAPERARLLGHSVETNLRFYTHARSDEYLNDLKHILDGDAAENTEITATDELSTPQYLTLLDFRKRKRTPKTIDL